VCRDYEKQLNFSACGGKIRGDGGVSPHGGITLILKNVYLIFDVQLLKFHLGLYDQNFSGEILRGER
jgi:hypothetical protein